MHRHFALVALSLFAVACSSNDEAGRVPLGAAATTEEATVTSNEVRGTVLEQIAASPYVYLRLKTPTGDVWAAVNETTLAVGAPVTIYNVMLMEQFESKSLRRTFDRIYFGALEAPSAASAAHGDAAPTSVGTPPAVMAQIGTVEKASGPDARTIAELWTQKAQLSGKTVSIRGVVVKYNAGVMGKNWIHLQDGSGNAMQLTHDITVTSTDPADVGATVTITGTVHLDRDFGAGYVYALIVEDAKVVAK